jgi:hypothetical protein
MPRCSRDCSPVDAGTLWIKRENGWRSAVDQHPPTGIPGVMTDSLLSLEISFVSMETVGSYNTGEI